MDPLSDYLQPTRFCDFDKDPATREKALQLSQGYADKQQKLSCIYQFVRELPYGLEDWDVKASETLRKGWGMCAGKTNLLVAMSRALLIPARYKILKIKAEQQLWKWIAGRDGELAAQLGNPPLEQDHIECEVYLEGWDIYDPSRDSAFEKGLEVLGIPLEREPASDSITLASIDEWAKERQKRRYFRKQRWSILARANRQIARIRLLGKAT